MKRINSLVILAAMTAACLLPVAAQAASTFGAAWSLAAPTGDTKEFTDDFSLRGFALEYRNYYTGTTAWGVNVGYNVFVEERDRTYYGDNFAVTGEHWSYINAVPMYLSWHKVASRSRRDGSMFFGVNAGGVWLEQRVTMGLYEVKESNVHLGFAPEIGYHFPWQSFLGYGSLRFNYMLEAGDVPAQSWFELRLGFGMD
jgi:hypothetical protein